MCKLQPNIFSMSTVRLEIEESNIHSLLQDVSSNITYNEHQFIKIVGKNSSDARRFASWSITEARG